MYFNVYMFGMISWETHGRHSDQVLAPMCRIKVTVMAEDADEYKCAQMCIFTTQIHLQ